MRKPPAPLFLARENYRFRRLTDAARLLPLLGLLLIFLPLMWPAPSTAAGLVWLFSVWLFLILCTAWLASRLARGAGSEGREGLPGGELPGDDLTGDDLPGGEPARGAGGE